MKLIEYIILQAFPLLC